MLNSFNNHLSKVKLPNNFGEFLKAEKQDQLVVVGVAGEFDQNVLTQHLRKLYVA